MSTGWVITCKKCGEEEYFRTGRSTDGMEGEEQRVKLHAARPCPKCGSKDRDFHPGP